MTSKAEKIGAALAKAVKAATGITSATLGAKMFRTNIKDVPKVEGLKRDDGWIDMQVQFLIDKKSAGADHVVGWTVLKPGASHECHRHRNCDEFFIVLKGKGHIITDKGLEPSGEGDVVYSPRGCWHGFNNTSSEDVVLVWGWMGAGSIDDFGLRGAGRRAQIVSATLNDPRIAAGMRRQFELRKQQLDAGAKQIGWKVGLGAPAALERCKLTKPVVGFLLDRAQLDSGAAVSLKGWTKPVAEIEIAAYIARDLPANADDATVRAAIGALGPAIELADLDSADGRRRGPARARHLAAPCHPGTERQLARRREARRPHGQARPQRQGRRRAGRPRSWHRHDLRHRPSRCRRDGRAGRRPARGSVHHLRRYHRADVPGAERDRPRLHARSDRRGVGAFFGLSIKSRLKSSADST